MLVSSWNYKHRGHGQSVLLHEQFDTELFSYSQMINSLPYVQVPIQSTIDQNVAFQNECIYLCQLCRNSDLLTGHPFYTSVLHVLLQRLCLIMSIMPPGPRLLRTNDFFAVASYYLYQTMFCWILLKSQCIVISTWCYAQHKAISLSYPHEI